MHAGEAVRGTNIIIHSFGFSSVPSFRWARWAVLLMCACVVLRMCSLKTAPATHISQLLCTAWDLYNWVCRFFAARLLVAGLSRFLFFFRSVRIGRCVCAKWRRCSGRRLKQIEISRVLFYLRRLLSVNFRTDQCTIQCVTMRAKKGKIKIDIHRTHTNGDFIAPENTIYCSGLGVVDVICFCLLLCVAIRATHNFRRLIKHFRVHRARFASRVTVVALAAAHENVETENPKSLLRRYKAD